MSTAVASRISRDEATKFLRELIASGESFPRALEILRAEGASPEVIDMATQEAHLPMAA